VNLYILRVYDPRCPERTLYDHCGITFHFSNRFVSLSMDTLGAADIAGVRSISFARLLPKDP
jgi:hypothetical protein